MDCELSIQLITGIQGATCSQLDLNLHERPSITV